MDLRKEYKSIILRAARIATSGGAMSRDLEDFIIENIDDMIDCLSEEQFNGLIQNGSVQISEIAGEREYLKFLSLHSETEKLLINGNLLDEEAGKIVSYFETLDSLIKDYENRKRNF